MACKLWKVTVEYYDPHTMLKEVFENESCYALGTSRDWLDIDCMVDGADTLPHRASYHFPVKTIVKYETEELTYKEAREIVGKWYKELFN